MMEYDTVSFLIGMICGAVIGAGSFYIGYVVGEYRIYLRGVERRKGNE